MGSRTLMSVAEFDALPEREGWKVELSAGELVMTASPRAFHNTIRDNLGMSLGNYAKANRIGTVIWELEFKLDAATVRIPDLAFVARERWAQADKTRLAEVVPDLAIEVVSPSNTASDLALKIQQYLRAGSQIVWVVYPELQRVHIYTPGERVEVRAARQVLDAPELLPGWSLPLDELFAAA
ncbi:MAG TPA: Uma2 family endonuclease [Terriglobales bacterium]